MMRSVKMVARKQKAIQDKAMMATSVMLSCVSRSEAWNWDWIGLGVWWEMI